MRYIFRADASPIIGAGHVMRTFAIAEELITRGKDVIFVGQISDVPWLAGRINTLGFSQILPTDENFVSDCNSDILILDSYIVPIDNEFIQQKNWKAIVVVVDELTPAYTADVLVHPGLSLQYNSRSATKVLAGPKYTPFRKSIQKNKRVMGKSEVLEILVVGGGTDSYNFVRSICETLTDCQENFRASIFSNDSDLALIDSRFSVIPVGYELDVYAANSDLVFTTASTSSLEFIAREVAVGIACAVDNQQKYYESLSCAGVAYPIGRFIQGKWEFGRTHIAELISSRALRESLRENCISLFDLRGSIRIAEEIIQL
jgi:spore coat polysaccharide biosynthesis predicted glycosyltransferase SpsG